jgi:hypothetical protein
MGLVLEVSLATALCLVVFIGAAFLPPSATKASSVRQRWKVLASRSSTARIQQCAVPPADVVKLFLSWQCWQQCACTPISSGSFLKLDTGQIGTFLAFTVAG